jgi:MOSC domain-containing protein YiiM
MATVIAVCLNGQRTFGKTCRDAIRLLPGLGVEGDIHAGETVRHVSRMKIDPHQPNLRQVHLIHQELFTELAAAGFTVSAGRMGENITTRGIDLLALPRGALLRIGPDAVLQVTGLRNPCWQLDDLQKGLMAATVEKRPDGTILRKTGVMSIVLAGGTVHPGDAISVDMPTGPLEPLSVV